MSQQQQQQQEQQEQQHPPHVRLLLELPGPALRRVLQLASTSYSPAICRLSGVSKAVRDAAEAAAAPVDLRFDPFTVRPAYTCHQTRAVRDARAASIELWLLRYVHRVRKLHLEHYSGLGMSGRFLDKVLQAAATAAAAAAAAAGGSGGVANGSNHGSTLVLPLEQLHLLPSVTLPSQAVASLATFKQLQIFSFRCIEQDSVAAASEAEEYVQMLEALSRHRQLRMLSLYIAKHSSWLTGDVLMLSMPPGLRALDLSVSYYSSDRGNSTSPTSNSCSTSSLAHLKHLTSLRLSWCDIIGASESGPAEQQQPGTATARAPSRLPWQQVNQLTALSLCHCSGLRHLVGPCLQAVSLIECPDMEGCLGQLSSCANLRRLRLYYGSSWPTSATGVSQLTQVTQLRFEAWPPQQDSTSGSSSSSSSKVGAELAAMTQLRQLELCHGGLLALQPQQWMSKLHQLEQLVLLVAPKECDSMDAMPSLTAALAGWHGSTSSGSDATIASTTGRGSSDSSDSSSSGTSPRPAVPELGASSSSPAQVAGHSICRLRCVQLATGNCGVLPWWRDINHAKWIWPEVLAEAHSQMQPAAADMAAALPWLSVACVTDACEGFAWSGYD